MHNDDDLFNDFSLPSIDRRTLLEKCMAGGYAALAGTVFGGLASQSVLAAPAADKTAAALPTDANGRLLSGRAWDDYCDQLRAAGHMIEKFGNEPSDLERAEWYRFMTRLARNGMERFVENCEPDRPRLRDVPWRQSINFQSPDQDHLLSEFVDGSHEYRITGQRGTVPYFVMAAWKAKQPADAGARDWAGRGVDSLKEFDPATLTTTAFLQSDTVQFDKDGNFEIILSQRKHPGNWLQLQPDSVGVLIRVVYHRRDREQAPQFRIERLDKVAPRPVTPAEMSTNLAKAGQAAFGYAELVRSWWQDNLAQRPNRLRFSMATYLSNGGVADRQFAFGSWDKPAAKALVVEFTPPQCEYWIFQLCNRWQENLDNYEDGQGYVTKFTARAESDGKIRIVIAEQDPQIGGNWVDPFQHVTGLMGLRLIKTTGAPAVTTHLVDLQELKQRGWKMLGQNTAIVSGEVTE